MEVLLRECLTLRPLFVTFLLGFTTFVLLFWYTLEKQKYWKKIGIPFAKPVPFLGSMFESFFKTFQDVELDRYNKYGRLYGHYEGNQPILSVGEPELLRSIFVKDFAVFSGSRKFEANDKITESMLPFITDGENWKRVRSIVTPTFTTGKLKRMIGIFKECSRTLVKNFKAAAEKGEPVEARSLYGAFTMDIVASSAFSTKIDSHNDPSNQFVDAAKSAFGGVSWRFILHAMFPALAVFLKIGFFAPKFINFFSGVVRQIIEERKRTGQTRNDFLQLLMDTAKETAEKEKVDLNEKDDIIDYYGKIESDQILNSYLSKKTLSQDELVAQCVIFFLAGYETTTATLSFVSYELALYPDVQEKLIKELDDALVANDGELTYDAVQSMRYLDNVIAETLRKYPPSIRTERMAHEDYKLGDTGLTLPKGMVVTIPIYGMHRDPKLFPNPEKFDPDRFTPEERAKRNPYSYLPFGAGPRNCVGMRFALLEMKVCLAHVLSNFRIKTCEKTMIPLEFYKGQIMLKPKAVSLFLEVRKDTVKAL